ncbi:MAG: flagellar hook protein FlgE [Deltaproteobacteria bacterium]|nr:flagellar hook protein FlgE [Deltaproteobacteria bacterium]MBZ0219289.1 flagellar hook protein FlgE [Deltaproteobacteria bacterium]
MQSALYTGISGLNANMSNLSVIGNNISNVNTVGFKGSRVTFGDVLSQTLSGGGGTNQIGLGVVMSSIQKVFTQGAFESTGNALDLAISGNGFYMVNDPVLDTRYYTRAGQFSTDKEGFIVNPEGMRLQGYMADAAGTFQNAISDIQLATRVITPSATTSALLNANLDSNAPITGFVFTTGVNDEITFDIGGTAYTRSLVTDGGLISGTAATADQVNAAIRAVLQGAASGNTYTVSYDDQTGMFSIANDAGNTGTLDFDMVSSSAASLLGFTSNPGAPLAADGSSYTSDQAGGAFDLANAGNTSNFSVPLTVYDSLGNDHTVTMFFRKESLGSTGNTWEWFAVVDGSESLTGETEIQAQGRVTFDSSGALHSEDPIDYTHYSVSNPGGTPATGFDFTGGAGSGQTIGFDFGASITEGGTGTNGTTQYATASGVSRLIQDGYSSGTLQRIAINQDGIIQGIFTNGRALNLAQVLLADFPSPTSLSSAGMNLYSETFDSGQPLIGTPGTSGMGLVQSETLELSNVDLAREFVNMITAQRGFQANSKIITTTDELLMELVNLKR